MAAASRGRFRARMTASTAPVTWRFSGCFLRGPNEDILAAVGGCTQASCQSPGNTYCRAALEVIPLCR
jgi:hypothetical protein